MFFFSRLVQWFNRIIQDPEGWMVSGHNGIEALWSQKLPLFFPFVWRIHLKFRDEEFLITLSRWVLIFQCVFNWLKKVLFIYNSRPILLVYEYNYSKGSKYSDLELYLFFMEKYCDANYIKKNDWIFQQSHPNNSKRQWYPGLHNVLVQVIPQYLQIF